MQLLSNCIKILRIDCGFLLFIYKNENLWLEPKYILKMGQKTSWSNLNFVYVKKILDIGGVRL